MYAGLILYTVGLVLFAFANQTWMMFLFLVTYCLGGLAGPALQSIMAGMVSPTEQGELHGTLTSTASATSIIGPPLMTNTFSFFTKTGTLFYFPGAPFALGAVFMCMALGLAWRALGGKEVGNKQWARGNGQ